MHCNVFLDLLKNKTICSIELDNEIWSTMKYNFVNINYHFMIIFSTNGKCEPYYKSSTESICDKYLTKLDYVYIRHAVSGQYIVRVAMEIVTSELSPLKPASECYELIARALCTYYYPKCGYNGTVHVPMTLCSDVCEYVSTQCSVTWVAIKKGIEEHGRDIINLLDCNSTTTTSGLNLTNNCCIRGGIILPEGIL